MTSDSDDDRQAAPTLRFVDGIFEIVDRDDDNDKDGSRKRRHGQEHASFSVLAKKRQGTLPDTNDANVPMSSVKTRPDVSPMRAQSKVASMDPGADNPIGNNENSDPNHATAPESSEVKPSTKDRAARASEEDEEVEIVPLPTNIRVPAVASLPTNATISEGGEVELLGHTGKNALEDSPHWRENCVRFSMHRCNPVEHCDNCFCYVCDSPVEDCNLWNQHCKAKHGEDHWSRERERVRLAGGSTLAFQQALPLTVQLSRNSTAAIALGHALGNARRHANRPELSEYSVGDLLREVTAVYPVEVNPPPVVRHTKIQQINGSTALALPEAHFPLSTSSLSRRLNTDMSLRLASRTIPSNREEQRVKDLSTENDNVKHGHLHDQRSYAVEDNDSQEARSTNDCTESAGVAMTICKQEDLHEDKTYEANDAVQFNHSTSVIPMVMANHYETSRDRRKRYDRLIQTSTFLLREMETLRDEMYRWSLDNARMSDYLAMQGLEPGMCPFSEYY